MEYLFERFKLTDVQLREEVERTINAFYRMRDYIDNSTDTIIGEPNKPDDYTVGLQTLEKNKVITFQIIQQHESELLFNVTVINRYNLELLKLELSILKRHPERLLIERAVPLPRIPNVTYYELSSGAIIINGKINTLRKTNKKLFDALFIAHPEHASRSELLKVIGVSKKDLSRKIALNEAFSNLRRACGVTARIISLSNDGGRLNGRVYPLFAQLTPKKYNR